MLRRRLRTRDLHPRAGLAGIPAGVSLSRTPRSITIEGEASAPERAPRSRAEAGVPKQAEPMELTFACPNCELVGHVAAVEAADRAVCRRCGGAHAVREEAIVDS